MQGSAVASERKHVIRTMNTTSNSAGGGESEMNQAADPRPYKAQVEVIFPTPTQAKHAMDVLSVDGELGDKVIKTFAIAPSTEGEDESCVVMRVSVEATEAKMLRVSLSSFYDLLRVVLRCYQEFQ